MGQRELGEFSAEKFIQQQNETEQTLEKFVCKHRVVLWELNWIRSYV